MEKLNIPYAEFYITNVCNLSCTGCNRFNNYNFKGFQRWKDHAEEYRQWSEQVNIGSIGILGGEPLLNPTFMEWVEGITELWPNTKIRIITNGFQLNRISNLYDVLDKNRNIELWVGIHNKEHKTEINKILEEFLCGELKFEFNNENYYQSYLHITDSNGVRVKVEYNWWFHQGAIINDGESQRLHESDPKKAHDICHMKTCHHFIRGKLYKCGVVALLPEYNDQHPFLLSEQDKVLLGSYQPLTLSSTREEKEIFIQNLDKPIEQCRFCPEVYHGEQIYALKKGSKL